MASNSGGLGQRPPRGRMTAGRLPPGRSRGAGAGEVQEVAGGSCIGTNGEREGLGEGGVGVASKSGHPGGLGQRKEAPSSQCLGLEAPQTPAPSLLHNRQALHRTPWTL